MDQATFIKFEAIFITLAVAASLLLRNVFARAQEAGRDGILRTMGAGLLGMAGVWLLVFLVMKLLPERVSFLAVECIAVPVLLAAFPAGGAFAAGLARLEVRRWQTPAVAAMALAAAVLEYFLPLAANPVMFVVLVFGLGSLMRLALRRA